MNEISTLAGPVPSTVRLDDQLCFALYAATNTITRAYRPLLDELGITYPQYLVLLTLWEHRSLTVGAIADSLHLPTHGISPIISRLEERGLAARVQDRDDRRKVCVELTAKGSELEAGAAAAWHDIRCQTLMDQAELTRLRNELLELVDRMEVR